MRRLFDSIKGNWAALTQFGEWLAGVLAPILIPPPITAPDEAGRLLLLAQLLIALLAGLMAVPVFWWRRRTHAIGWWRAAVGTTLAFIISVGVYVALVEYWTCFRDLGPNGQRFVVGRTEDLLPTVADEFGHGACEEILRNFQSPYQAWDSNVLRQRKLGLTSVYVAMFVLFAGAAICITQAIFCVRRRS